MREGLFTKSPQRNSLAHDKSIGRNQQSLQGIDQRVPWYRILNDLQRTRLSRHRMIRLLSHPLSPVSKLSLFLSLPMCRRSSFLTGEGGGGGQIMRWLKILALYQSFNIRWDRPIRFQKADPVPSPIIISHISHKDPILHNYGLCMWQCCGSMTFWYGSGSADSCL